MTKKLKRIVFEDTGARQAALKVRLDYDGLKQSQFFRAVVTGYLEKDEDMMNFVERLQREEAVYSKRRIEESKKLRLQGEETKIKFGLEQNDIENIFDLIEEENPDL